MITLSRSWIIVMPLNAGAWVKLDPVPEGGLEGGGVEGGVLEGGGLEEPDEPEELEDDELEDDELEDDELEDDELEDDGVEPLVVSCVGLPEDIGATGSLLPPPQPASKARSAAATKSRNAIRLGRWWSSIWGDSCARNSNEIR